LHVRIYDGEAYTPIGVLSGYGSVEVAFDISGPSAASISLPANSRYLLSPRMAPGGAGAFWEIDARGMSVPTWTGRVPPVAQWSPTSPDTTVQLRTFADELGSEPVPAMMPTAGVAAWIASGILDARTAGIPVSTGYLSSGRGVTHELRAETTRAMLDGLARDRGEAWSMSCLPGRVAGLVNWYTTPDRRDLTDRVVLIEGVNCEPDTASVAESSAAELVGTASSLLAGTGAVSGGVFAPGGSVVGLRGAFEAEILSMLAFEIGGNAPAVLRPDIPNRAALYACLEATLRRRLPRRAMATCEITDRNLWRIRPGDLVLTRWPTEPSGEFRRAIALVTSTAYSLTAPLGMTASLELWERL
jgi:hypothetical protein